MRQSSNITTHKKPCVPNYTMVTLRNPPKRKHGSLPPKPFLVANTNEEVRVALALSNLSGGLSSALHFCINVVDTTYDNGHINCIIFSSFNDVYR